MAVDGDTAPLTDGDATWRLSPCEARDRHHQHHEFGRPDGLHHTRALNAGDQQFGWNGKDASGLQWPDGNYTISITAKDAAGQAVAVPTEIQAVVDSADLTQTPPTLSIAGQGYTLDKIKRVVRKLAPPRSNASFIFGR